MTDTDPTYVVFDAECVLCNGWVQFILRHEHDHVVVFAARHTAAGLNLATQYGVSAADLDHSYLVIENGQVLLKSSAGLALLRHLKAPFRWLRLCRFVPRVLRDWVYDLFARNRYRWFGKQACSIPPADQRHRFLTD